MAQLTMKDLAERIDALEDDSVGPTNEGEVADLYTRVADLEEEFSTSDSDPYRIPEWGYDILKGLIEALNSVRLARAQELEFELSAKYFPEGVESSPYPGVVHTTGE